MSFCIQSNICYRRVGKFCGRKLHTEKIYGRKFCDFIRKQAFHGLNFAICALTFRDSTDRGVFAMASSSGATFTVESCARGYHIYKDIWDATIGEELQCTRESNNSNDCYAVAVRKNDAVVGHVPRKISRVCALFLEHNGTITYTITGPRRRSADLPQGGMELPCVLAFSGNPSDLLKVKRIMTTLSIQPPPQQASNDEPEQECSD